MSNQNKVGNKPRAIQMNLYFMFKLKSFFKIKIRNIKDKTKEII